MGVSVSVSVLTLSVISIERFYAICHPLQFKATTRRARTIILVIWIVSLLLLLPDVVVLDTHQRFPPELTDLLTTCKPTWEYHHQAAYQLFITAALFLVPVVLMGVAYTKIAICLWSTVIPSETGDRRVSALCLPDGRTVNDVRSQTIARRNVARMLIAVVVMFIICYLPVHLLNIIRYAQVGMTDLVAINFALVAHWMCYFNSAINPVIYNFMSEKFQRAFLSALTCYCRKNKDDALQLNHVTWNKPRTSQCLVGGNHPTTYV